MTYSFHPAAEAEFLESVGYYESKVPGLGGALIEEFESLAKIVTEVPKAWRVELQPDIRRAPLHRFPLSVVYRESAIGFQVLAVARNRPCPAVLARQASTNDSNGQLSVVIVCAAQKPPTKISR